MPMVVFIVKSQVFNAGNTSDTKPDYEEIHGVFFQETAALGWLSAARDEAVALGMDTDQKRGPARLSPTVLKTWGRLVLNKFVIEPVPILDSDHLNLPRT